MTKDNYKSIAKIVGKAEADYSFLTLRYNLVSYFIKNDKSFDREQFHKDVLKERELREE